MSDPLFVHVLWMSQRSTPLRFALTSLGSFVTFSSETIRLKKQTEQMEILEGVFGTFCFTGCDKAAPPTILIGQFLFPGD